MKRRQLIIDTETTGLSTAAGHRVVEIGIVELINRRYTGNNFHRYINPMRQLDIGAVKVHGITYEFLQDKPKFGAIAAELWQFLCGADELIAHNATFDLNFLEYEYSLLPGAGHNLRDNYAVTDTLGLARKLHPGQRNSLDALCKRYQIDSSVRNLHGALLDAKLLAEVYLAMTSGQAELTFVPHNTPKSAVVTTPSTAQQGMGILPNATHITPIIFASAAELAAHAAYLELLANNAK